MSRLVVTSVGGDLDDTVTLRAAPEQSPEDGDIIVAVEVAPINNGDLLFAAGLFASHPEVPAAMGVEGVGRVVDVGTSVDPGLKGVRVLILPAFGYNLGHPDSIAGAVCLVFEL